MKRTTKILACAVFALSLAAVIGCSKDNEDPTNSDNEDKTENPTTMKYVSQIDCKMYNGSELYYFVFDYNDANKITRICEYESNNFNLFFFMNFEYRNNSVIYSGTSPEYDVPGATLLLNSNGYVESASSGDNGSWKVIYNNGYISQISGKSTYGNYENKAEWGNENLTTILYNGEASGRIVYGTLLNNENINIDLNWIIDGAEGCEFLVNNDNSIHTTLLGALGLYGKRSKNYKIKTEDLIAFGGKSYVYTYEYTTNPDGSVARIVRKKIGDTEDNVRIYTITYK